MAIYIYGIINSNEGIDSLVNGLEGSHVYNIPYHDIGAAVSNFHPDTQEFDERINRSHIFAHERVVEKLIETFTVLPARFFTIFYKKEDVLSVMKNLYGDFRRNLDRLHNKVEFGLKVIWPGEKIRKNIIDFRGQRHSLAVPMPDNPSLENFIRERYVQYKLDREIEELADSFVGVIDDFFRGFAHEKKLEKLKTKNLLLSAYYLVDKESQDDLKKAFERLKKGLHGFMYLLSGPWPPYNFIILTKKPHSVKNAEKINISSKIFQKRIFSDILD